MKIALVTTWDIPCGIADYGAYWADAVKRADPSILIEVVTDLHPDAILSRSPLPPVIVLNYQAALLSQWQAVHIEQARARKSIVITIWHDSGVPNSDHCKAVCGASNWFILHEPYDDLPSHGSYLHHAVPDWEYPIYFDMLHAKLVRDGVWWGEQPIVGTLGLSLGYRNIDLLCEAAEIAGWGVLVIASRAADEDEARWKALNPATTVIREFVPRDQLVSYLAGCTANAQLTVTNNAGVSGAIRQCMAARKPIIAFRSRQFIDLWEESAIRWLDDGSPQGVADALSNIPGGVDNRIVRLAARDSWTHTGTRYAGICRDLLCSARKV